MHTKTTVAKFHLHDPVLMPSAASAIKQGYSGYLVFLQLYGFKKKLMLFAFRPLIMCRSEKLVGIEEVQQFGMYANYICKV